MPDFAHIAHVGSVLPSALVENAAFSAVEEVQGVSSLGSVEFVLTNAYDGSRDVSVAKVAEPQVWSKRYRRANRFMR